MKSNVFFFKLAVYKLLILKIIDKIKIDDYMKTKEIIVNVKKVEMVIELDSEYKEVP